MSDIVERLRAHKTDIWDWNGAAMTAWDGWRSAIAKGDKSSWPRDAFESLIGGYGEDMGDAADEITTLRAEVERLAKLRTIELEHSNRWLEERDTLRAEVERLKARDAEWLDVGTDAHGVITRMKAELTALRAEVGKLLAALCADEQTLRLHLGEMTAQEMRTVKAGFKWVLARAALGEEKKG